MAGRTSGARRTPRGALSAVVVAAVLTAACTAVGDDATESRAAVDDPAGPDGGSARAGDDPGQGGSSGDDGRPAPVVLTADEATRTSFGPPPSVPDGPLAPALRDDLDEVGRSLVATVDVDAVRRVGTHGDARVLWYLADLLRFTAGSTAGAAVLASFEELTDVAVDDGPAQWQEVTDRLIAWDLPAAPGYVERKRQMFTIVEPGWDRFFADEDAAIDWRQVSWGGVLIDDRPLGDDQGCPRGCIPALDDPSVTDADGGDWYDDDRTVFGVVVDGEARAYPKHQMQVHEMVNDTLGGVRLGIPYCTLCGSAQAFVTGEVDAADGDLVLRTSGLLSRSNKVMYDLVTGSVFDTFTGEAVSGPLHDADVQLDQVTVVTTSWGEWKQAHPGTTIVAEDGGIGRTYADDPLRGRDDDGPIFPIGDVDERQDVQTLVVGAVLPDGSTIAFDAAAARDELAAGGEVVALGVRLLEDAGGLRAELDDGTPLPVHEAFWFAWSQFHPATALWTVEG